MKNRETYTDKALILSYLQGENEALVSLVQKWHQTFCRIAFSYVQNAAEAKDVAQESWVVLIAKLNTLEDPVKFKSWAIQIVKRKALDQLRKSKRYGKHLENFKIEQGYGEVENDIEKKLDTKKEVLRKAIADLSPHHQQIIRLFYVEEYSLQEISELLEISKGTVKSRLFHAREKLKKIIK